MAFVDAEERQRVLIFLTRCWCTSRAPCRKLLCGDDKLPRPPYIAVIRCTRLCYCTTTTVLHVLAFCCCNGGCEPIINSGRRTSERCNVFASRGVAIVDQADRWPFLRATMSSTRNCLCALSYDPLTGCTIVDTRLFGKIHSTRSYECLDADAPIAPESRMQLSAFCRARCANCMKLTVISASLPFVRAAAHVASSSAVSS